jgi:hypothetical protein
MLDSILRPQATHLAPISRHTNSSYDETISHTYLALPTTACKLCSVLFTQYCTHTISHIFSFILKIFFPCQQDFLALINVAIYTQLLLPEYVLSQPPMFENSLSSRMSCSYWHFGGIRKTEAHRKLLTRLHGVISQKILIFILSIVETSNFIYLYLFPSN